MFAVDRPGGPLTLAGLTHEGLKIVVDPACPPGTAIQVPSLPNHVFMHPRAFESLVVETQGNDYQTTSTAHAILKHERRRRAMGRRETEPTGKEALERARRGL